MPLFQCSKCGCIENTAVSNYWTRNLVRKGIEKPNNPPLCSECDPEIEKWHGNFEKKSAVGYFIDKDGFLWSKDNLKQLPAHVTIVGYISEKGITNLDKFKKLFNQK